MIVSPGLRRFSGVVATGPYLPSNNPASLVAWFRQGVGVTVTGSGVSEWADQSGNGRHLLQTTDAARPSYNAGTGVITFDGAADFLRCNAFTLNQPEQVSALIQQVSWTDTDSIWDGNASNTGRLLQWTTTPRIELYAGAFAAANTGLTVGAFFALSAVYNGASSSLKVGDAAATTGNAGANNMGGFTLGCFGSAIAGFSNIAVKEIIIRNVDNATIRAADHTYLQTLP